MYLSGEGQGSRATVKLNLFEVAAIIQAPNIKSQFQLTFQFNSFFSYFHFYTL